MLGAGKLFCIGLPVYPEEKSSCAAGQIWISNISVFNASCPNDCVFPELTHCLCEFKFNCAICITRDNPKLLAVAALSLPCLLDRWGSWPREHIWRPQTAATWTNAGKERVLPPHVPETLGVRPPVHTSSSLGLLFSLPFLFSSIKSFSALVFGSPVYCRPCVEANTLTPSRRQSWWYNGDCRSLAASR